MPNLIDRIDRGRSSDVAWRSSQSRASLPADLDGQGRLSQERVPDSTCPLLQPMPRSIVKTPEPLHMERGVWSNSQPGTCPSLQPMPRSIAAPNSSMGIASYAASSASSGSLATSSCTWIQRL